MSTLNIPLLSRISKKILISRTNFHGPKEAELLRFDYIEYRHQLSLYVNLYQTVVGP